MTGTAVDFFKAMAAGDIVFNLCDISKAKGYTLEKVIKKKKTTASSADIAFSNIALAALGKRKLPIALKIFQDEKDPDILGLKYEMKIYQRIIEKIILKNQSPNFVGYIASACCKKNSGIYRKTVEELLGKKDYCILVTEKVGNGAYFGYNTELPVDTYFNLYPKITDEDRLSLTLQICYSLELLQRYRIVHNDLHANNILVMILPKPVTLGFNIDGKMYKINTRYIPYIFDWDLAYCEDFGNNPKIEDDMWYKANIHNKFNKKTDLFILLCTLRSSLPGLMYSIEDQKITIKLSEETVNKIAKFVPLFKTEKGDPVYRFGTQQIIEFFGQEYSGLRYGTIFITKKGSSVYASFYKQHDCRPSSMHMLMETPLNLLERKCSVLQVNSLKGINQKYVYTMPAEEKNKTIFIDPLIARRGRTILREMGIKPRFSPLKTGSLKVKIRGGLQDKNFFKEEKKDD